MTYGIQINYEDGVSIDFDSKFTTYKLAATINLREKFYIENKVRRDSLISTGVIVPEGYNYLILYSRGECYVNATGTWYEDKKTYNQPVSTRINSQLNSDREIMISYSNSWNLDYYFVTQLAWIILYPAITPVGEYGLLVNGLNENFSSISNISDFTKVVWSGDVEIPVSGVTPSDIDPSFTPEMLCFFYWEDNNVTMGQTYDSDEWNASYFSYGRYFAYNINGYRTPLKAKMVIFGNDNITKSKYGFEIYNSKGDVVFSASDKVFHQPEMIDLTGVNLNHEIFLERTQRPLISPRSIGGYLYPFTNRNRVDRAYYDVSFANTGNSLIVRRSFRDDVIRGRHNAGSFYSKDKFPVLDASYYFNFGD